MAASRRERGSEDGLADAVVVVSNGRGAGSGHESGLVLNVFGVGICRVSSVRVLKCNSVIASNALVKNSLTDLVWWYNLCRCRWNSSSFHRPWRCEYIAR